MFITNGVVTRNIAADKLQEYKAKGYSPVEAPPKPKKAAKTKAGDK